MTREAVRLSFGVLHIGDQHMNGEVQECRGEEGSRALVQELTEAFSKADFPHSTGFRGRVCPRSSKASGGEELQIEEPVCGGSSSTCHLSTTLTGMLGAPLSWSQVVQLGQPSQTGLLGAFGMRPGFPHAQFPLAGMLGLLQQRAGHRHRGVVEHRVPARFRLPDPAPHACPVGHPRCVSDMVGNAASPLAQRKHPPTLPLACPGA
jgi:hypothetical protein